VKMPQLDHEQTKQFRHYLAAKGYAIEKTKEAASHLRDAASISRLRGRLPKQLMAKDALTAHARDELGISEITAARPVQAALTSAVTFSVGAAHAVAHGCRIARQCACSYCFRCVFGVSLSFGSDRGKSGGCKHSACHSPSNFLGRIGDGPDCRHREIVRHGCLMVGPRSQPIFGRKNPA
jgi:hypothetical protein